VKELNKANVGLSSSSTGAVHLNRTAGDILIDFDFGGSGVPALTLRKWITGALPAPGGTPALDCESSNSYPCWGKGAPLSASVAESSVNSAPVNDTNAPAVTLDGNTKNGINSTFGEAAINLQAAGIFQSGVCTSFADAWVKSRSSGNSFTSELKDIIAPIPTSISSCGTIIVKKVTNPSPDPTDTSFSFTAGGGLSPTSFSLKNGESKTYSDVQAGSGYNVAETVPAGWDLTSATCDDGSPVTNISVSVGETVTCTFTNRLKGKIIVQKVTSPSPDPTDTSFSFTAGGGLSPTSFSLKNGGSTTYSNVTPGNGYNVAETVPAAWELTSATCDDGSPVTNIDVAAGETVTCTFTNTLKFGALKITKQSIKSGHAGLQGAEFHVTGPGGYDQTLTSGSDGTVCVDGLLSGGYSVTETKAPTGYTIDNPNAVPVTVNPTGAKCGDATGVATVTFNDTPKTDLDIVVQSQDSGAGGSHSTITCTKDSDSSAIGNSPQGPANKAEVTATGLAPGDYTCKVNIDP
jgi:Prealbumin-like fold domain/Domain of unknown function (DUF5979)